MKGGGRISPIRPPARTFVWLRGMFGVALVAISGRNFNLKCKFDGASRE